MRYPPEVLPSVLRFFKATVDSPAPRLLTVTRDTLPIRNNWYTADSDGAATVILYFLYIHTRIHSGPSD
jgi:hypothetical protein